MKENIEEVIEYLDGIDIKFFLSGMAEQSNYIVGKANEVNEAVEILLSDYKRVLEENEEWQRAYQKEKDEQFELVRENQKLKAKCYINSIHSIVPVLNQDYIKKQKIQDKIEELKSYKGLVIYERCNYESQIKTLQDLLEEKGE